MPKSGTIANSNDGSAVQEVAKLELSPLNLMLSTSISVREPSFNLSQNAFLNNSTPEAIFQPYRIEYPTIPSTMTENRYSYSQNSFGQIPREGNRTYFIPENPTNLENLSSTNKPINFDGTNQDTRTNEIFEKFSGVTETAKSTTETAPPMSTIPNAISLATPSREAKNLFIPHAEIKTFGELENPSLSTNNNGELSRTIDSKDLTMFPRDGIGKVDKELEEIMPGTTEFGELNDYEYTDGEETKAVRPENDPFSFKI